MKRSLARLFMILLCISLAGCSRADSGDSEQSVDAEVNVAVFDGGGASIERMLLPTLMEDTLYYWDGEWDRESGRWHNTSIYRKAGGGTDVVEIVSLGDNELVYFTVDEAQNLYYLYGEYTEGNIETGHSETRHSESEAETDHSETGHSESETETEHTGMEKVLYLKKEAPDGSVIYDIPVPAEAGAQILGDIEQTGYYIEQGTVSTSGEFIIRSQAGNLYLFDDKGEFLCAGSDGWDGETYQGAEPGLLNAGEKGIFTYAVTNNGMPDSAILLSRINMTDAVLGAVEEVKPDAAASLNVYSGYAKGILISDGDSLWGYDPAGKKMNTLLDWDDSGVEMDNYDIDHISILKDGRFYVMVTGRNTHNVDLVYIEKSTSSETTEKQTVVIGGYFSINDELENMIKEFNKYNTQYHIEFKQYESSQDLYMDLLKGEGPDGFQLTGSSILASKGVLEDLSPYFAESQTVREEDLLPSVREAGSMDGKLYYLFPHFRLKGLIAGQGVTDNGAWTPEEFLGLGEQHPEALLTPYIDPYMVMEFAISADMDSFVHWQDRECFFDSERFVNLLESIRQVTDGRQVDYMEIRENQCQWLHDGKTLTDRFWIGDVRQYVEYRDAYEGFGSFAGYPDSTGEPYYWFEPDCVLAMNSASGQKDGVWAFMEFLLSERYQYQNSLQAAKNTINGHFPVRQDVFDEYLTELFNEWQRRVEHYNNSSEEHRDMNTVSLQIWQKYPEIGEEDREMLLNMVENAHWDDSYDQITRIIMGETGSLWSGDKTAEEVAGIIQNRVQLYLDEM